MSYVGIPFVDGGRDASGCDCWGLVRLVLANEYDIDVPSYGEISVSDLLGIARAMQQAVSMGPWVEVKRSELRAGDVVVMKNLTRPTQFPYHVGIMVSPDKMLHTEFAVGAHTVLVDDKVISDRVICYRRHRKMA